MTDTTEAIGDGDGRVLAGRYALRGLIGHGGMADVELAHDQVLDRQVAVKILHARYADDPSFLERFRREAQAAANMNHANVVAVYDTGSEDGRPYIVMEYVAGQTLRAILRGDGLLPHRAADIGADAADALHYAHERGFVHRDVKPANIMVDNEGKVKVADFGIARAVNAETVTQTATVFGTAAYIAPEQAQGHAVDRRTDVYALGCVVYEMLTGRQPFSGESAVTLAYKHISEPPPPPREITADISPELEAVVLKAMAKSPDERYQSAKEFADDLRRAAQGLAVAAPLGYAAYAATQALGASGTQAMAPTAVVDREPIPEEPVDDRAAARRKALLWLLVLAALIVGALLLFNLLQSEPETVEVEVVDVIGLNVDDAVDVLTDAGFQTQLNPVEDPEAEEGEVTETDPAPGELAEEGSTVEVTYSTGIPLVQVPDVTGQPENEALSTLEGAGLQAGQRGEQSSDDVEEGRVLSTNPAGGTEVEEGSAVSYVVSTGPAPVTVPDVRDRTESDARSILSDADLQVADGVSREFSDDIDEGRVIRTDPASGQQVAPGTTVTLVISRGPDDPPEPEPEPTPAPTPTPTPTPTPPEADDDGDGEDDD